MKEKNIFIGILIIALIAIGVVGYRAYYGGSGGSAESVQSVTDRTPGTSNATPANLRATIIYDASGFSPKPLGIVVGTTVVFMNQSATNVWPASAPHPAHTDYPEFDAKRAIEPGGTYEFTFDRIGTWKYHNHINPTQFGSIVVTE